MKRIVLTGTAVYQRIQGVTAAYGRWDADFQFWLCGRTKVEVTPTWCLLTKEGELHAGGTPSIEMDFCPIRGADQHGGPNTDDDDDAADLLVALLGARRSDIAARINQRDRNADPRSQWNSVFSEYVALIPADLRRLAGLSPNRQQWTTLRALRAVPEFARFLETELQCVGSQFIGTCFNCANAGMLPGDQLEALVRKMMTLKRHEVLTDIVGAPVSPSAVRIIMKCGHPGLRRPFDRDEVKNLLNVLGDTRKAKVLRHASKASVDLINTLAQLPRWACHANLLPLIEDMSFVGYSALESLQALPEDAPTPIRDYAFSKLPTVSTARELQSIAESLCKMYKFRAPPILGDHRLQPLRSAKAMLGEAAAMHNCIGNLIGDVVRGTTYYYRWRGRQRATVELVRADGVWRIHEVVGFANGGLDRSTLTSIRSLVKEQLRACRERSSSG